MDIQESLLTSIYNLLTADATLQTAMGGTVRLYPVWAPPDAAFPYLVHRLDLRPLGDWSPQVLGTYMLDVWADSSSAESTLDIAAQLKTLLDGLSSSTAETTEYWLWIQYDGFVPEPEEGIRHYAMQFNLKYLRDAQVGATLTR